MKNELKLIISFVIDLNRGVLCDLIVSCFEFSQLLSVDLAIFAYFAMVVDLGTNFDYHTSQAAVYLSTDEEINQNIYQSSNFTRLTIKLNPVKVTILIIKLFL